MKDKNCVKYTVKRWAHRFLSESAQYYHSTVTFTVKLNKR